MLPIVTNHTRFVEFMNAMAKQRLSETGVVLFIACAHWLSSALWEILSTTKCRCTCDVSIRDVFSIWCTGAGHIIRISSKSWFISLIPFKKWNLYNVYIHSTQTDIFQVFIYLNFDDYNWQLMKTPNSVSQKIRILLKTNTKKGFLEILANWKVWTWNVWACTALNT